MQLVVLGLNHKTASVDVRECFSFSEEQVKAALRNMVTREEIAECVILSTCNRTEMYAVVDDAEDGLEVMQSILTRMADAENAAEGHFYVYLEDECIAHLFRVSSSLDSLVIGEGQILSQVKKAYAISREVGMTSTVLNTLFNRAIAVGKKVRTQTRIAYNAVSVSYAAVELAKHAIGDFSASNVLLLGAGEMSELTARHLVENGVKTVFVSNRRFERAAQLADKFQGIAVPFEEFMKCAVKADIVITSTGAPHYIIRTLDVAHLMAKRQGQPIIFIDIAVPRDVEPEVAAVAGVSLYNIDDLEAVVECNIHEREQEARRAEVIIAEELQELVAKFRYLSYQPTMARLTDKAEMIRQRELKRALAKLPESAVEERRVLENMSKMLVRKLLRDPMMRIHEAAVHGDEQYYLDAVRALFKLDAIGDGGHSEKKSCYRYARQ
ncbi:Glutamyl-tRNA reductase [Propionispora sp. 2/2-37]|uniref:glutamyl-tRNA reductase n=1 Tax=Propionispora sp. 2/2-37 TaxID=1677858 RepID=UPI0006BB934B|nr:glutamyl-tRNA reductase [Propionispora sp. 2/2-37]CUH95741.1 Glutamyl-tRNA reductase [Propionispora sp. 2/2-37]